MLCKRTLGLERELYLLKQSIKFVTPNYKKPVVRAHNNNNDNDNNNNDNNNNNNNNQ